MNVRSVLHLDLDSFFVAVERLQNPELIGKPLIVGGNSSRGVVASCSYETRLFGVRSAMPIRLAKQLCPDAIIINGDMQAYSKYSEMVTDIISTSVPILEKASIDEFYADLSGMDRFFGCYKISQELKKKIQKETGLPISLALAVNKLVSKVATGEVKPQGAIEIPKGTEREYFAPMAVRKLPGVGEKMGAKLYSMGVKTIRTLREIPPLLLQREFGDHGKTLWEKANAMDETPVIAWEAQKSMSKERTFQTDTTDIRFLHSVLLKLTEELAYELRNLGKLTACVTVKIRYSDFNTFTKQQKIALTSSDQHLIQTAKRLFDSLYDKRLLIRLVGVHFSHLINGGNQMRLFETTEDEISLCMALDKIRHKYGSQSVFRAGGMGKIR